LLPISWGDTLISTSDLSVLHAKVLTCAFGLDINVKKWLLTTLTGCVLVCCASTAWSLGFGQPTSHAVLGETLGVNIPVKVNPGEEFDDACLAADVFFGDDKLASSAVSVSMGPASGGQRLVRIKTNTRIQEPVFTVYLVAGCKAKITRKVVGFADPPGMPMDSAQVMATEIPPERPSSVQTQAVVQPEVKTSPLPGVSGSSKKSARVVQTSREQGAEGVQSVNKVSSAATRQASTAANAQGKTQSKTIATAKNASSSKWTGSARIDGRAPQEGQARLELDPAAADALVEPSLNLTGGMALPEGSMDTPALQERRAAAAALWAAMNASPEQLARDRQRMQELESRLARLQQDAVAATKKLQDMEVRVREAEDGRLNHPLVYGLAGVCALLAGALGWIFLRQKNQNTGTPDWWQGNAVTEGPVTEPGIVDSSLVYDDEVAHPQALDYHTKPSALTSISPDKPAVSAEPVSATQGHDSALPGDIQLVSHTPSHEGMGATQAIHLKQKEPMREMSVEELIDLEQQADFFVVLGQDHAATELLESHVQSGAGASPLPFLKLLEIYQRLGQREDYERVQQSFNHRFNAYAPSWESDLQQGDALQDYPGVLERLQALWSSPGKAMEVLHHSLIKPDEKAETFDLPAYRELLLLYSVARDLSERQHEEHSEVDIDVPDLSLDMMDANDTLVAPLTATRPIKSEPKAMSALQVDFSLDEPALVEETVASKLGKHLTPIDFVVVPDDGGGKPKA
jgi:pilus assembly protein FimV